MEPYEWDYDAFFNTLTTTGEYKFHDDDFEYYVKVTVLGNKIGQQYWSQEEGYDNQYIRSGYFNEYWQPEWNEWTYVYLPDIGGGNSSGGSGIIDLGFINLTEDWEGSPSLFMKTLTETGAYTFNDEYGLTYYVQVNVVGNVIGQYWWGDEEGYKVQKYRQGNFTTDGVEWTEWFNYMFQDDAFNYFARTNHSHYNSVVVDDVREYLDNLVVDETAEHFELHLIIKTGMNTYDKYMVKTHYVNSDNNKWNYQEYFDLKHPEKIYRRSGYKSNTATKMTWGKWYVFEGAEEQ